MNVLHVNEHLAYKGGVETYLLGLLPFQRAQGITAVVAYAEGDASLYSAAHVAPAIGEASFRAEAAARDQLGKILRAEQPDLIHVHNLQNVGALQACLEYGPTVITTHDYRWVCPANSFFYKRTQEICSRTCGLGCFTTTLTKHCVTPRPQYATYFYRRARWAVSHANRFAHVIAPSEGARMRYASTGFGQATMSVLPYFCELEPAAAPRPLPEQPTITFLGRIAPNKGHEYFIEALGQLPRAARGFMVGNMSDEGRQEILSLARRHGCADRLELQGWASRAEVLNILDQTTVFIFPSLWPETLGIVGIEALSRGVPVVASDVGGVREWCHDGETGYVVPPKDATAISEAVQRIMHDEEQLLDMGRRGLALIRERFLPSVHLENLLDIYASAIGVQSSAVQQ